MDGALAVRELEFDDRPCRSPALCGSCLGRAGLQCGRCHGSGRIDSVECGGRVSAVPHFVCQTCGAKHLRAQAGQQTKFLESSADIIGFGGGRGGSKTHGLLLHWLDHAMRWPNSRGLIIRRQSKQLNQLWAKATEVYEGTTPIPPRAGNQMDMRWPNGSTLVFKHLDDKKTASHKGPEYTWVGIEEADECQMSAIIFLLSCMRSTNGSRPVMVWTSNPAPDHPIAEWVDPYLHLDSSRPEYGTADRSMSGRIRWTMRSADTGKHVFAWTREECGARANKNPALAKSFAFIPALVDDNKAIDADEYRRNFAQLDEVTRAQHEDGNWKVRVIIGGMLPRHRWGWLVPDGISPGVPQPRAQIVHRVRAWDLAGRRPRPGAMNPDYTIGLLVYWDIHGRWYIAGMVACREEPPESDALMSSTASLDGPSVTQVFETEGGASGVRDVYHIKKMLTASGRCGPIVDVRASLNKEAKLKPVAAELRLGMNGNVPREIDMVEGDDGVWEMVVDHEPRGYFLDQTGWMDEPYTDAGEHPPTLGALARSQIFAFFNPEIHDDVPDTLGIAHQARPQPPVVQDTLLDRIRREMR